MIDRSRYRQEHYYLKKRSSVLDDCTTSNHLYFTLAEMYMRSNNKKNNTQTRMLESLQQGLHLVTGE